MCVYVVVASVGSTLTDTPRIITSYPSHIFFRLLSISGPPCFLSFIFFSLWSFRNSFQFSYFYVVSQRSKDVLCEDSGLNRPGLTDRGVSTYFLSTLMFWLSVSACGHSHADSVWLFLNLCSWNFKMENWKKHRFLPVNEWTCIRFHRRKVYIFVVQQGLFSVAQHQFNLAKN